MSQINGVDARLASDFSKGLLRPDAMARLRAHDDRGSMPCAKPASMKLSGSGTETTSCMPAAQPAWPPAASALGGLFPRTATCRDRDRENFPFAYDRPRGIVGWRRQTGLSERRISGYVGPDKSDTLTHGVAIPAGLRHKAMTPVYLLRSATGKDPAARAYPQPGLMLADAERQCGRRILARLASADHPRGASGPRIGIFANATRDKLLEGDWWRAFIEAFEAVVPGCRIVEILPAFGQSMLDDRFPCFYSSDIRKLAALIENLDAYVSADCGVMHLAWAVGTSTIGLFNVTDPAEWGPFGPRAFALTLDGATPEAIAHRTAERLALAIGQGATVAAPAAPR
ncbi:MAG: glycosyltransferase family 9 protein [Rhodanobacteraceae bacterium]